MSTIDGHWKNTRYKSTNIVALKIFPLKSTIVGPWGNILEKSMILGS